MSGAVHGGQEGPAARPAPGNVELGNGFPSPLGLEVTVGGRIVAHQAVNEGWQRDFVGWAPGRERLMKVTVGIDSGGLQSSPRWVRRPNRGAREFRSVVLGEVVAAVVAASAADINNGRDTHSTEAVANMRW